MATPQQIQVQQQPLVPPAMAMPVQGQPVMMQQAQPMMVQQPMMAQQQPMMVQQPMMAQQPMMMMQPTTPPLEHFLGASSFLTVKQEVELLEAIVGFETENEYKIIGIDATTLQTAQIGKAFEQSDCCTRQVCGPQREFEMRIQCAYGSGPKLDVLRLDRPFRCCQSPACCMLQELTVTKVPNAIEPMEMVLGKVQEIWSACGPKINIVDANGAVLYVVEGPCIRCDNCCCDVTFEIKLGGPDGPVCGTLKKMAGDALTETFTDADTFGIQFPNACPTDHKALLLGCVFLIDMMFFEKDSDEQGVQAY